MRRKDKNFKKVELRVEGEGIGIQNWNLMIPKTMPLDEKGSGLLQALENYSIKEKKISIDGFCAYVNSKTHMTGHSIHKK